METGLLEIDCVCLIGMPGFGHMVCLTVQPFKSTAHFDSVGLSTGMIREVILLNESIGTAQ